MPPSQTVPRVLADLPVSPVVTALLEGHAALVPWESARAPGAEKLLQ